MLAVRSLSVGYDDLLVLREASLEVGSGEVMAIIGPNGAGKSTLMRAVSGLLLPRQGRVYVGGEDITYLPAAQRARLLAVVPQSRHLPGEYTVYQTVLLGRTPYLGWLGRAREHDHARVRRALQQTDTLTFAERKVGQLSGGEQQRVLLARALVQDTPVLLLDEPTTYLDLHHQAGILTLVRTLASENHLAVLMVLHDLNLAASYADRLALMVEGRIWALGSPHEVLTSERLSAAYRIPVEVIPHPRYGTPLVLADGIGKCAERRGMEQV